VYISLREKGCLEKSTKCEWDETQRTFEFSMKVKLRRDSEYFCPEEKLSLERIEVL